MLSVLVASAVAASLAADMQEVAKLPGEPSIVSAAGFDPAGEAVLTLENQSAFDPYTTKRRVVIWSSAYADRGTEAALRLVRWMKTSAPARIRNAWVASALPAARFSDTESFMKWMSFQNADVSFEVTDAQRTPEDLSRLLDGFHPEGSPTPYRARIARSPGTIANLLAARYPAEASISYIAAVAWSNTLQLALSDPSLRAKVERQIEPWRSGQKELFGSRIQLTAVAGTMIFGDLAARDDRARALFLEGVDAAAKVKEGDLYEYGQGWTDDMFMATVVLMRSGEEHRALAARMLAAYAGRLQRPDGLFNHAVNGPVAWGRGNGFAALGLVEALPAAPEPLRGRLLDVFRSQMQAVRAQQAPDGMWREVIDEPAAYREESATAMLLTAMARGVRLGFLDRSYDDVVLRAWRGLAAHVQEDGTVVDVCTSTGAGATRKYYLDRAAITGADDRGGAMALMAAVEMSRVSGPRRVQ